MNNLIKTYKIKSLVILLSGWTIISSCDREKVDPINNNEITPGNGEIELQLTSTPVVNESIKSINVKITGVDYLAEDGSWKEIKNFGESKTVNLQNLRDGSVTPLGTFIVPVKSVAGLRFHLDFSNEPGNPGSFVEFNDGTRHSLLPAGNTISGFSARSNLRIADNGIMPVIADFNLIKSLIRSGSGINYLLNPSIRIESKDQTGFIDGHLSNVPANGKIVVFAYENGKYNSSESNSSVNNTPRFGNAESSGIVNGEGSYTISYLKPGNYELVAIKTDDEGNFQQVISVKENVAVMAKTAMMLAQ